MCTNWKRFTFKTVMLACVSLFLYACAADTPPEAPALREVRGVVADSFTGQSFPNALVTVYAVDATGHVSTTPLSTPSSVRSDGQGNFVLNIPETYVGAVFLQATENGSTILRAVLPSVSQNQSVVISLATEMVVQYITENKAGIFTPVNIQKAILVQEPFFGQNFMYITPPAIGATPTDVQQRQLVMTQSVRALQAAGGYTIADLVKNTNTGIVAMGEGSILANLTGSVATISGNLINSGAIPGSYTTSPITPIPEPVLSDVTSPSAPHNLSVISTTNTITLAWDAASDDVGVVFYYIYRNGVFINSVATTARAFTDNTVASGTTYAYEVKARDAAGNLSAGSSVEIKTLPLLTYVVSGRITSGNSGLASVYVIISGSGSGVFVTDTNGNYTIPGVRQGNYTISAILGGYDFTPVSRALTVSTSNIADQNFTAEVVASGTVTGGVTYPPGTIIGGISYPSGAVIGGVTYPTATVIGGVVYPTGTVIGGITYPSGIVIGGVSYPAGTVVGGIAFPIGAITSGVSYPNGTIIGGISYPSGTVIGAVTYPTGATVIGGILYPTGTVIGGITYPNGVVIGGVSYPAGTVVGGVAFPIGTVTSGFSYPNGTVIGGIIYPTGTVAGGVTYPPGTIVGGISYPSGVVIGGIAYPTATVVGGVVYPTGTVVGGTTYPNGIMIGGVSYPAGTVVGGVAYPVGATTSHVTYPSGTVVGGVTYPGGVVIGSVTYPNGVLVGSISYPTGSVIGSFTYPAGTVVSTSLLWNQMTNYISGAVTYNGVGLRGVLVTVKKDGVDYIITSTGTLGYYSVPVPVGTYTISASLAGYTFAPIEIQTITIDTEGSDVNGQDFTAATP